MMRDQEHLTRLLKDIGEPGSDAWNKIFPMVYSELREMAHRHLRKERSDHTLGTTALVHEAYIKLVDIKNVDFQDRQHFYSMAARSMRRILVDFARARLSKKRGGDLEHISMEELGYAMSKERAVEYINMDEALSRLEKFDPRASQVVEHRFFNGFTLEETAEIMDLTVITARRSWYAARAWLRKELAASGEQDIG